MELLVTFNTQSESQTAKHLSAPSVVAILCDSCRCVLSVGDTVLETLGRYFHFNCLKCVCCSQRIATAPFLPIAGLFPVCKGCWLTKSHRFIEGLINTPEAIGRWRHEGQANEFWIQSQQNMAELSNQCRQHSTECYVCRNPIIVGCPYVHLDERPIHAHCLICSVCGVRLTDKAFVAHQGQYACQNHAFSELSH